MLQDIAPQVYHNEFYIKKPQNHDGKLQVQIEH